MTRPIRLTPVGGWFTGRSRRTYACHLPIHHQRPHEPQTSLVLPVSVLLILHYRCKRRLNPKNDQVMMPHYWTRSGG